MTSHKKIVVSLILVVSATLGFFLKSIELAPSSLSYPKIRPADLHLEDDSANHSSQNTIEHDMLNQDASLSDNDSKDPTREPSPTEIPQDPYKQLRESSRAVDYTHTDSASYLDKTLKLSPELNQELAPQVSGEQNDLPGDIVGEKPNNPYEHLKSRSPNAVHPERDTQNYIGKTIQLGGSSSN